MTDMPIIDHAMGLAVFFEFWCALVTKKNSDYDQEIIQSHTQSTTLCERATEH